MLWSSTPLTVSNKLEMDLPAIDLSKQFGSRFSTFSLSARQQLQPFLDLLPDIREATVAVDRHHLTSDSGCQPNPQLGDLVMFAISVHYRILCLAHSTPDTNASPATIGTDSDSPESLPLPLTAKGTLELLRLATLLYSDLVIFPLGLASRVRFKLCSALRSLYITSDYRIYSPEFEMWILAIGAIGSVSCSVPDNDAKLLNA